MTNKTAYRDFCKNTADLPLFVQDWYLDACCKEGEWDVALVRQNEQIVATLPYFSKTKAGLSYITMPMFVKMMGVYIIPSYRGILKKEHLFTEQLIEQLPPVAFFKQNFHPTMQNWLPFLWKNYQQTTYYTYVLDQLDDLESVFGNFNRSIKRNIKKAKAAQLQIHYDLSPEEFYAVNEWSFQRNGMTTPYSKAQFLQLDQALAAKNARQIFCAKDTEGRIHAASYLAWDQQSSYYLFSGDDPELRKFGAGIWLVWDAIRYTKETLGLPCFDFEGSIIKRLEEIRLHFGARQVPYFFVWKYHNRWIHALELAREWLKKS